MSKLGSIAARGAATTMVGQVARIAIQVISLVVLARLLTTTDYGLVAMAAVVTGLADVFRDFGLSSAAIQAKTLNRGQKSNLFWANAAIGAVLTTAIWFSAPLVAWAYNDDAVTDVLRGLAWVFLINGVATQYRAQLNRALRFGTLAVIEVAGQAVGAGLAIALALLHYGWWALVWSQIAAGLVALVAMVAATRWLPGPPSRRVESRALFTFGWNMVLTQTIGYIGFNIEKFIIGQQFGSSPSGVYDRPARLISLTLTQLRSPTTSVALPILAKLQDDASHYMRFLVRGQVGMGYSLVAATALAAAAAYPVVAIVLGDEFAESAPILQALAAAAGANTLTYVAYWVFVSRGLTKQLSQWSLFSAVVRTIAVLVGVRYGLLGVAWSAAIVPVVIGPLSLLWISRLTNLDFRDVLWGYVRIAVVTVAGATAGFAAERAFQGPVVLDLVVACAACVGVYLAALVLPIYRRDLTMLGEFIAAVRAQRGARKSP